MQTHGGPPLPARARAPRRAGAARRAARSLRGPTAEPPDLASRKGVVRCTTRGIFRRYRRKRTAEGKSGLEKSTPALAERQGQKRFQNQSSRALIRALLTEATAVWHTLFPRNFQRLGVGCIDADLLRRSIRWTEESALKKEMERRHS